MDVDIELSALEHTFDDVQIDRGDRSVRMHVGPYAGEGSALHFVALDLTVALPPLYPDEAPLVAFENCCGLSDERLRELRRRLAQELAEAPGEPVLIQLCMAVQEHLSHVNHPEGVRVVLPSCTEAATLCPRQACVMASTLHLENAHGLQATHTYGMTDVDSMHDCTRVSHA